MSTSSDDKHIKRQEIVMEIQRLQDKITRHRGDVQILWIKETKPEFQALNDLEVYRHFAVKTRLLSSIVEANLDIEQKQIKLNLLDCME